MVFLTHDHWDHYSPKDLAKVANDNTIIVTPRSTVPTLLEKGEDAARIMAVEPYQMLEALGIAVETVPAYNLDKNFHPRANNWLGYVVTVDGTRIFVAGDTDMTPENSQVKCDIALLPAGGTYTMTAAEAAQLANTIRPTIAVPMHYGYIAGTKDDGKAFAASVDEGIEVVLKLHFDD